MEKCDGNMSIYSKMRQSIGWFKGKIAGNSHTSWENLWFPVYVPLSQPIEPRIKLPKGDDAPTNLSDATTDPGDITDSEGMNEACLVDGLPGLRL